MEAAAVSSVSQRKRRTMWRFSHAEYAVKAEFPPALPGEKAAGIEQEQQGEDAHNNAPEIQNEKDVCGCIPWKGWPDPG